MAPKKQVRFANTVGKPLVSVREIERVGKSHKILPQNRKFVPADMKKLKAKHEIAERRAVASLSRAEDDLNKAQKIAATIRKTQIQAKLQLLKEKNPAAIKNIKEKINRMNASMKNLVPHLENRKITVNVAKNKLKAQRQLGLKKSRFSFV
jgi:predicted transcriptional regulator